MYVTIASETAQKVKEVTKILGVGEKALVDRALLFYIDAFEKTIALKKEFKDWDDLSDEAWKNVDEKL